MHSSFRALLKQNGADKLAQKISTIKYPISRPDAALADPYKGEPWKAPVERARENDANRDDN